MIRVPEQFGFNKVTLGSLGLSLLDLGEMGQDQKASGSLRASLLRPLPDGVVDLEEHWFWNDTITIILMVTNETGMRFISIWASVGSKVSKYGFDQSECITKNYSIDIDAEFPESGKATFGKQALNVVVFAHEKPGYIGPGPRVDISTNVIIRKK